MKTETNTENALTLLTPIQVKEADLKQLAEDYKNLVVTRENIKEVDAARKKLKNARRDIEKPVEDNVKALNARVKKEIADYKELAEKFVKIIKPVEDRLDREQTALEEKEKAEQAAKLAKEEKRKRDHRTSINGIEGNTAGVRRGDYDHKLPELEENISFLRDSFEEFSEEGNAVIDTCLQAIENRKAFLSDLEASKAKDEPTPPTEENEALNPREGQLISLGFTKEAHSWTKGEARVPFGVLDVSDEAWDAMMKPHTAKPVNINHHHQINPETEIKHSQEVYPGAKNIVFHTNHVDEAISDASISQQTGGGEVFFKMADKTTPVDKPWLTNPDRFNNLVPDEPLLNTFQIGEYTFGISKNVPMAKAGVIRKLVKAELEK